MKKYLKKLAKVIFSGRRADTNSNEKEDALAKTLFGMPYRELNNDAKEVIHSIAEGEPIAEDVNISFAEQLSIGERLADKISTFGGSWSFIILFSSILATWMVINSFYLITPEKPAFDPYPYILLNLVLSTLAAFQAPIIMMSQNRQAEKDRLEVSENYRVSLKSDLEITRLHKKIDQLSEQLNIKTNDNDKDDDKNKTQ